MSNNEGEVFLGVVVRDGSIYIPWRGTNVHMVPNSLLEKPVKLEYGQNLLVTIKNHTAIRADLPTLAQLKQMKDELDSDWQGFTETFKKTSMARKVRMLRALDQEQRLLNAQFDI